MKKYGQEFGNPDITIADDALKLLLRHSWPGNIRELENVIQRLIIMSGKTIYVSDLPDNFKHKLPVSKETSLKSLKEVEIEHIQNVLLATNNNKTKASEILKIDRKTLSLKLKQ